MEIGILLGICTSKHVRGVKESGEEQEGVPNRRYCIKPVA